MGNTVAISQTPQAFTVKEQALEVLKQEARHFEIMHHDKSTEESCGKVFHTATAYSLSDHRLPVVLKIYLKQRVINLE